MSIGDSFAKLIGWIQPSDSNVEAGKRHSGEIGTRLESQGFEFNKMRFLGSHSRGTAVESHSDMDLFAIFKKKEVTRAGSLVSSDTVLSNVRKALAGRYTNNTKVGRDGEAITVSFSDISVDVVPAFFEGFSGKYPLYSIPNGNGGWMQTSPDAHNDYITQKHESTRHKFRYATQLVKYWRECRTPRTPLSSFHLEILFASEGIFEGVKSYAECVRDALGLLCNRKCRGLQDPLGISGVVNAANNSLFPWSTCQQALESAYGRAARAVEAENGRDQEEARRLWKLVFNSNFPS